EVFVRVCNKVLAGEPITKADFIDERGAYCRECKSRYPDIERKVCPKCMKGSTITRRLLFFFKRYKAYVFWQVLASTIATSLLIVVPLLVGNLIFEQVLSEDGNFYHYRYIGLFVLLLIVIRLFRAVFMMIQGLLMSIVGARVVHDIKALTFTSMQRLSLGFFVSRQTGGLMTRVTQDANILYWFFVDGLPWIIITSMMMVGIGVAMFVISWWLALVVFGVFTLGFISLLVINAIYEKMNVKAYSKEHNLNAQLTDSLEGKLVIKAFGKEKEENQKFRGNNVSLRNANFDVHKAGAGYYPVLLFIIGLATILTWGLGGWQVIEGNISFGSFVTFTLLLALALGPLDFLSEVGKWWSDCLASAQRVFEILDSEPSVQEKPDAIAREIRGDVEFSDVGFYYNKNKDILKGINFKLEAGKNLGIVGKSGVGKSTLVNLIFRLYDTTSGEVLVDGTNIKDYKLECIHKAMAIVSQEIYLFNGTVLENIRYGRPSATREEVIEAAKIADCHNFIVKLAEGYETYVTSNKEFSGGEKQRISIARAILKNPSILILDEATAAMDTQTEQNIQNAIANLSKNKTTITIAHRLSTLKDVDSLIVIDEGRVAEAGTHKELMQNGGIYARLFGLQMEASENILDIDNLMEDE
ncbi:MAG: ABC transporter ATP-binding protein/permease, partial [Firmicutes bacterium]|nr:ABC transporter ATP-binding protein/permease [Bacillota bacterium]